MESDRRLRRVEITPVYDATVKRTRLGFSYAAGPHQAMPLGQAFDTTTNRYWYITKQTVALNAPQ